MNNFCRIGAALLVCVCVAQAQFDNELENGTNQVVDTVWNTNTIWVGNTTTGNQLYVVGEARASNTTTYAGNQLGADNNLISLQGSSEWTMSGDLYVGNTGSFNYLEVREDSLLVSSNGYVGAAGASSNNLVAVFDAGSRWTIEDTLSIGDMGGSNRVFVFEGGMMEAGNLLISTNAPGNSFNLNAGGTFVLQTNLNVAMEGFNWNGGGHLALSGDLKGMESTNGAVTLNGGRQLTLFDGGTWTNGANDLIVGYNDSFNTLAITNGASVDNANGYIGWGSNSTDNAVLVSDAGSQWRNHDGLLYLGTNDAQNSSLTVTNEAWVYVGEATTNEFNAGADGGIAVASTNGATLIADNGSSIETTGGLYIGGTTNGLSGTVTVSNRSSITTEELVIEDGSTFNLGQDGSLSVGGDLDLDAYAARLNWAAASDLTVGGLFTKTNGVLDGSERSLTLDGGSWDLSATNLVVAGISNSLYIADGAGVTNLNAFVATGSSNDTGNSVWVQGGGSSWLVDGTLNIGATNNSGNAVTVRDGGRIQVDELAVATNNSLNLNEGGTLALTGDVFVPGLSNVNWNANGNLSVGGTLSGMNTTSNAAGNAVVLNLQHDLTLDGASALWDNAGTNLIVGNESSNSDLMLTNAATLTSEDGYIGWGASAGNNSVYVGDGSIWNNTGGDLYVGVYGSGTNLSKAGTGNRLTVAEGGWVNVGEVVQTNYSEGMLVASTNGAQLIVGKGTAASATIEDTLYLGYSSNANGTVTIGNQGTVSVGDLVIANTNSWLDLQRGGTFAIDADFNVADRLTNGFSWADGGRLSVGGTLTGMYTTNLVFAGNTNAYTYVGNQKDLTLDGSDAVWDLTGQDLVVGLDGDDSALTLLRGAALTNNNTFIGWGGDAAGSAVDMNFGATWINSNDLWIGRDSDNNHLFVGGGSTNWVGGSAYLGNTNTSGNYVEVSGSNSLWAVEGDVNLQNGTYAQDAGLLVSEAGKVQIGNDLNVFSSNTVVVTSDGSVSLGGNMNVDSNAFLLGNGTIGFTDPNAVLSYRGAVTLSRDLVFQGAGTNTLAITDGSLIVVESNSNQYVDFEFLRMTNSTLTGVGSADAFGDIYMEDGHISPGIPQKNATIGRLEIIGDFDSSNTVYSAQILDTEWDELAFTGPSAVDLSGLEADILVALVPTGGVATILTSENGFSVSSFASTNLNVRPLLFDGQLVVGADDVEVQVSPNGVAFSSALTLARQESVRAGFGGMKNAVFTRTKQLRRNLVATAHAIPQEAYLLTNTNAPAGAMGPGDNNTIFDMHIWMQQFSGQGDYNQSGDSYGFRMNKTGTTIGADRLFGDALTVGINYTYARADTRTTNDDELDTETYWIGAYGQWVGKDGLYVDALAAGGFSSYDSIRREEDYLGEASYKSREFGAYVDVGQYYHYKNLALSPYVGLHILTSTSDAYEEAEVLGDTLVVEEDRRTWAETALGLKLRHRFDTRIGRFQTTGYAEWMHDFINEDVYAEMSDDFIQSLNMARIAPDADVLNTGLGLSLMTTDYLEFGIGYNGRFSENYEEHAGSLMLDVMF